MLVILEGQDIYQKFELVQIGAHPHCHIVFWFQITELVKGIFINFKLRLIDVNLQLFHLFVYINIVYFIDIIGNATSSACLDVEIGVNGEAWHVVIASTNAYIIADGYSHIDSNAQGPDVHTYIQVVEDVLLCQT